MGSRRVQYRSARDGDICVGNLLPFAGIAVDAAGNVAVSDIYCNIRLIAGGMISTVAGGGAKACVVADGAASEATVAAPGNADGTGGAVRFQDITAMAVDAAGRIYVVDSGNHAVRLIEAGGRVRTLIPLNVGPRVVLGEGGSLNSPIGIALLPGGAIAVTSEFGVLVD